FTSPSPPRHLPPFPTRRSSDLRPRRLLVVLFLTLRGRLGGDFVITAARDRFAGRQVLRLALRLDILGINAADQFPQGDGLGEVADRKSTRLNSSHSQISYAVFC